MLSFVRKETTPVAKDAKTLARAMTDAISHLAERVNNRSIAHYNRAVVEASKTRTVIPNRRIIADGMKRYVSNMCDMAVFKVESLRDAAKVERAVAQGMAEVALGFVSSLRSGEFENDLSMMQAVEDARRAMMDMAAEREARG